MGTWWRLTLKKLKIKIIVILETLLDLDVVKRAKLLGRKKDLIDTVVPVNKHDLHENVVRRKHCPKVHTQ